MADPATVLRRRRVLLGLNTELALARQVFRGIVRYNRIRGLWTLLPHFARNEEQPVIPPGLELDGVIGHFTQRWQLDVLRQSGLPFVNVSNYLFDATWPVVTQDDPAVGRMAAEHLLARGYRHFAFVSTELAACSFLQRGLGFAAALQEQGARCEVFPDTADRAARPYHHRPPAGLARWLADRAKPLALFCHNDTLAAEVLEACQVQGLTVPDQVAVLGVDNDDILCELALVSLSSVSLGTSQVGFAAAELLDRLLHGEKPPAAAITVPPVEVATRTSTDAIAVADPEVAAALRHIREHAGQPLTVEDVAAAVAMSRRALERRFRQLLQRTPRQEIMRAHVERARRLLVETSLPLRRVASECGFGSLQRFDVGFRQSTGETPSAYRRRRQDA